MIQQLVIEKIQNLKAIASTHNANGLVAALTEAQKRSFPSVQSVEQWFKSVLKQQKNYELTVKWMNIFERLQIYREVWRQLKNGNESDMLEFNKWLNSVESKITLTTKEQIMELTTKMSIQILKEPKLKQHRDFLRERVQELAALKKQKQKQKEKDKDNNKEKEKGKVPAKPAPMLNVTKQQRPEPAVVHKPTGQQEKSAEKQPSSAPQKKIEKSSAQSAGKNDTLNPTSKVDKPEKVVQVTKVPKEERREQPIQISMPIKQRQPKKQLPSFSQIKAPKAPPTSSNPLTPPVSSFAPFKPRIIANPHDQMRCIENKLTASGYFATDKSVIAVIKKQLNEHMKNVLLKIIRLSGLNNTLGNQDQFTYFSKKNDQNPVHFPNTEILLNQRVPRKDRFFKVTYPHKLRLFCQLRIQEQRQQQKLRVQDKRKRKQAEKQVFQFVRGETRATKFQFKEENTKVEKVTIKLPAVQAMMEMDPFYSKSRILEMSYYL